MTQTDWRSVAYARLRRDQAASSSTHLPMGPHTYTPSLTRPATHLPTHTHIGRDLHSAMQLCGTDGQRLFGWRCHGCRVALEVARALAFLHQNHIVHLDVKSENCLLSKVGTAKLAGECLYAGGLGAGGGCGQDGGQHFQRSVPAAYVIPASQIVGGWPGGLRADTSNRVA